MRHLLLLFMLCGWLLPAAAQDVIIRKDGQEVEADILRLTAREVFYKRWDNPEGPEFVLSRSEIVLIRYADGRVQILEDDYYQDDPEPTSGPTPPAPAETWNRRHVVSMELLSYVTGHLGINYKYQARDRLRLGADLGIVGLGQAVRPGYRNEVVFSGGSLLDAKSDEQGFFLRLGPEWSPMGGRVPMQGFYAKPELSYSLLRVTGEAYQRNGQPSDYDYTFTFTGHTLGLFIGGGYQLVLAESFVLDASMALGYAVSIDGIAIQGVATQTQPLPGIEGPLFRYSHFQIERNGGLAFTMGLSAGFAF